MEENNTINNNNQTDNIDKNNSTNSITQDDMVQKDNSSTIGTTQKEESDEDNPIMETIIPENCSLSDINLPNQWVLYLYDKQQFKKMVNRPNFQAKPHKEICTITTVNDLVYLLQLMEIKTEPKVKIGSIITNKINLDANDYIIMRKGIEPIWEDPKNSNGGTFTIKMDHSKGYDVWSTFIMYMLGETLTHDMHNINGITVSYISDASSFHNPSPNSNNSYTYIKIWDGKLDRTRDQFLNILPMDLYDKIKNESLMYSQNNKKKDFGAEALKNKSTTKYYNNNYGRRDRGDFISNNKRRY